MLNLFPQICTIFIIASGYYKSIKAQPDLVPDLELLQSSIILQDVPLRNLQCSSEEKCLTSSAYTIEAWQNLIFNGYRRLMRFSMRVINIGDVDFAPFYPRDRWIWHTCHNHFHSVETFALYDIVDRNGTRVAAGLKVYTVRFSNSKTHLPQQIYLQIAVAVAVSFHLSRTFKVEKFSFFSPFNFK